VLGALDDGAEGGDCVLIGIVWHGGGGGSRDGVVVRPMDGKAIWSQPRRLRAIAGGDGRRRRIGDVGTI
jgi:hypothetical protein